MGSWSGGNTSLVRLRLPEVLALHFALVFFNALHFGSDLVQNALFLLLLGCNPLPSQLLNQLCTPANQNFITINFNT